MEVLKKFNLSIFVYSLLLLTLGICLVAIPNEAMLTICYILGAFAIVMGIASLVEYFVYGSNPFGLVAGLFELCFGIVFVACAKYFMDTGVFAVIIGLAILFMGIYKVQESLNTKRAGIKFWWVYLIYAVVMIALSIVIITNPFSTQKAMIIIVGILCIMTALCEIIMLILLGDRLRQIKKNFFNNSVVVTPVVVEETKAKEETKAEEEKKAETKKTEPKRRTRKTTQTKTSKAKETKQTKQIEKAKDEQK